MCAKGRLCCRLPHTCAPLITKLLIRIIVAKPVPLTHTMISASSREHLVTDHRLSFRIWTEWGGFLGGGVDEQSFEMCWKEKVQRFGFNPQRVKPG